VNTEKADAVVKRQIREKICIKNSDIRKIFHALDNEDNNYTTKRKSITQTDFSTNFLKNFIVWNISWMRIILLTVIELIYWYSVSVM